MRVVGRIDKSDLNTLTCPAELRIIWFWGFWRFCASMPAHLLTTGDVARRCSVKPDTVLKWIKKGRLPATLTIGGHYRVDENDLAPLMACAPAPEANGASKPPLLSSPLR